MAKMIGLDVIFVVGGYVGIASLLISTLKPMTIFVTFVNLLNKFSTVC